MRAASRIADGVDSVLADRRKGGDRRLGIALCSSSAGGAHARSTG